MKNCLTVLKKAIGKALVPVLISSMFLLGCGNSDIENVTDTNKEEVYDTSIEDVTAAGDNVEEKKDEEVVASVDTDKTEEASENKKDEDIVLVLLNKKVIPESDANLFVKEMGAGWCLGNTFDANDAKGNNCSDLGYETYWQSNYTTRQNIIDIKEAGFSTIRIPVSWHNHVDEGFNISKEWLARVKEVVNWAMEEGLYVVVDIHHDNEKGYMYPSYETLETSKKYVSKIWSQVATELGEYDEHLIFECLNEPRLKDTNVEWWIDAKSEQGKEAIDCINQLNQVAVDTIRNTEGGFNSSRYIMCPSYCAAPEFALSEDFTLPEDSYCTEENRILLSIHAYTPYSFALDQNASSAVKEFKANSNSSTSDIDDFMGKIYRKYVKNGIGVVIGEFGSVDRDGNIEARVNHAAYYVANARNYGMSCIWWDNNNTGAGEKFCIYDRQNNTMREPLIVKQLVYYGNK